MRDGPSTGNARLRIPINRAAGAAAVEVVYAPHEEITSTSIARR